MCSSDLRELHELRSIEVHNRLSRWPPCHSLIQLKRLVMVESVAPLLMTSVLSCGIGVWTGAVFTGMFSTTLKPTLTPTYFAIVGVGLAAAIIGIYLILPMVDKLTRAEANQTE